MIVMLEAQKRGFDKIFFNRLQREVSTQDIPLLSPPGQTYFKYFFVGLNRDGGFYLRWYQSTGRTRMQSGKLKYKKLEVMQPRITEYKSELLTREQIISRPDLPAK